MITKMNNKGSSLMLTIILAMMFFFAGMLIINFLGPDIDTARTALNCADATAISDGVKLTCLIVDGVMPYWIIMILSIAGGFITEKLLV